MAKDICVCLDFLTDAHKQKISDLAHSGGYSVHFFDSSQEDQAAECGKEAEILYAGSPRLLRQCEQVKWYCCCAAGVDVYCNDPTLFHNPDCLLTNSNVYGVTISEHTVMVALMLLRRVPAFKEGMDRHQWLPAIPIRSITGCHLTMLGTGQIGQNIALRFHALGAEKIIGVNRSGRSVHGFDAVYPMEKLDDVLPKTEILVMALPNTEQTKHVLNRERLALLPKEALVINVGRGTAIDQDALREALNAGQIAGAALDVTDPEPLPPDHPLWEAKNLILSPHVAGGTSLKYTCDKNVESFCHDLENYMSGKPLDHLVNRARGY